MEPVDRPLRDCYWEYLRVRDAYLADPAPALAWWMERGDAPLNPVESTILEFVRSAASVVDIGAGDGRVERRLRSAGFSGHVATVDTSPEFHPDFSSVEELPAGSFDAALLLEVIEHVPLAEFDALMDRVIDCLTPDGRLVVSTPNAAYVGSIWEADMTHVHAYRLQDLAAYLHLRGFDCRLFRVAWQQPRPRPKERVRLALAKIVARGILQLDYARGVLVLAHRRA